MVSALDHRFGWSPVPTAICLVGDVLVAVGLGVVALVLIQNSYAASTVQVEAGQTVVSTGLYGLVRHPMYTGNVIMLVGIPLALGSYWGLVFVIPGLIVLAVRIRDEEKLLQEELTGYREYTQTVRHRLVPRNVVTAPPPTSEFADFRPRGGRQVRWPVLSRIHGGCQRLGGR